MQRATRARQQPSERMEIRSEDGLISSIEVRTYTSMRRYKRNQIEEAIFRMVGARGGRLDELRLRLKRLLVTDRRLGRDLESDEETTRHYAFFSEDQPGSGIEVKYSDYEAFALLVGLILLEHGLPQATVVKVMRQVRRPLEAAHGESLKKDPSTLFDQQAVLAQAKPGMLFVNNTDPIFLAFVRLTDSAVGDQNSRTDVGVCRGQQELIDFVKKHSEPGLGVTLFELVGRIHGMAMNLLQIPPTKRGRGAT
jgi:hypothetical protein